MSVGIPPDGGRGKAASPRPCGPDVAFHAALPASPRLEIYAVLCHNALAFTRGNDFPASQRPVLHWPLVGGGIMVRMNSFLQINPSGTLTLPKVLRKALGVAEGGVVMYWTLYPKPRSLEKP